MGILDAFAGWVDRVSCWIGRFTGWLTTGMVLIVFYDTIMRYAFNRGNVALQELEWHLFALIFLVGAAYTLKEGGHVRVDIFFMRFSPKAKALVDLLGHLILLIPFSVVIILSTEKFVFNSWAVREVSSDPGGLPARYLLKAMIPVAFTLLIIQAISEIIKNILVLCGRRQENSAWK